MKKNKDSKNIAVILYTLAMVSGISVYAHKPASAIELIAMSALLCGYILMLYNFRNPRKKRVKPYRNNIHFS